MGKKEANRKPRYFFLAFGAPYSDKHPVEGGRYPHHKPYVSNLRVTRGDVMLLYCAGGYPGHDQEAPGIGVVTDIQLEADSEISYYRYLPLDHPVDLDTLKASIKELQNRSNFSLIGNWLIKIARHSFRKATMEKGIDWP